MSEETLNAIHQVLELVVQEKEFKSNLKATNPKLTEVELDAAYTKHLNEKVNTSKGEYKCLPKNLNGIGEEPGSLITFICLPFLAITRTSNWKFGNVLIEKLAI